MTKKMRFKVLNSFDRDRCRAPMSFDGSENRGFTNADKPWLPHAKDDGKHNVLEEAKDPNSVLNFYKKLLKLRQNHDEFTLGEFEPCPTKGALFAYRRYHGMSSVLVLVNLSDKPVKLPDYLSKIGGALLLSEGDIVDRGTLPPYGVRIHQLS